jgi:hypothetical protein
MTQSHWLARWRATACATAILAAAGAGALACGGTGGNSGFTKTGEGGPDGSGHGGPDGGTPTDSGGIHLGTDAADTGSKPVDSGPPMGTAVVYAESPGTLYKLDPLTNTISIVAPFSGDCEARSDCQDVIDIALDSMSNGYATTFGGLYSFDVTTAVMTFIKAGSYPNSLSFVPKGTLSATEETLVGYNGANYLSIDTTTGVKTVVGALTDGLASSGDIVSVSGGGTFLTVNGTEKGTGTVCSDCLLQVDPKTGDVIQNYGSVNHESVYGLAFWGGVAYGFDDTGVVFSITFPGGTLTTTDIPVPGMPPGMFYGAGSTTSAPAKQADGGGIPIK